METTTTGLSTETQELIKNITQLAVEGLKFIPAGEIEEAVKVVQAEIAAADFSGEPKPVTIIHRAVNIGQLLAVKTESAADDKLFGKVDQILDNFEENGEKAIAAIIKGLFQKLNPTKE